MVHMTLSQTLVSLSDEARRCRRCPGMRAGSSVLGPANGAAPAAVMFVAEAPGYLGAVRSALQPPLNAVLDLAFELPNGIKIETQAAASYQVPRRLGLVFHATAPGFRRAIGDFVTAELAQS